MPLFALVSQILILEKKKKKKSNGIANQPAMLVLKVKLKILLRRYHEGHAWFFASLDFFGLSAAFADRVEELTDSI